MTLRELYEMVGNSTIPPDAEVEIVNGELRMVAPVIPPKAPSPAVSESRGYVRTSRGITKD